ncbi:MAG: cupin-like domain-containing protein [Cyclobacteriaceae bacterium]|nr:cupin-like domain-containing protein [Cyclobacteriaceae bacterium]
MPLLPIERRSNLSAEEFQKEYLSKNKPVIIKDLSSKWSAIEKWQPDFLIKNYGNLEVPIYSDNYSNPGSKYMSAEKVMKFGDYLELICSEPTDLRMFLFNIFKHAPELCNDISDPQIMKGFLMKYPMMFFGGEGSSVRMHYDIDLSHVFHTQIFGEKRVVLFDQDQSVNLYHHPFTVKTHVDVDNPDFDKYPLLRKVTGYEATLYPGETVFMPSAFWHYMQYKTGGYALSLRANESYLKMAKGLWNILVVFEMDKLFNKMLGQKWLDTKENWAINRANQRLRCYN